MSTHTDTFRIGLLGASRIAPSAIVNPSRVIPAVEIAGVAARSERRAKAFASEHGITKTYADYHSLISAPDIDLIYISLPVNLHAEWTIKALGAGKHVLCEKPLAMNIEEAKAMATAARDSGKRLIEAFHYRHHPAYARFLDCIKSKEIGGVKSITAHFNTTVPFSATEIRHHPKTGGGAMMDLGCYPLNWILSIAQASVDRVSASAVLNPNRVDESMQAELVFSSGINATLSTSMAQGHQLDSRIHVSGTHGEIIFLQPLSPPSGGRLQILTDSGKTKNLAIDPVNTFTHQLANVYKAIKAGTNLAAENEALTRQQGVLDRIYESAGLHRLRKDYCAPR